MKRKYLIAACLAGFLLLSACSETGGGLSADNASSSSQSSSATILFADYSVARAMNARIGKGINFGNSWDSQGSTDGSWGNPIYDEHFTIAKNAGFNSIRLPVRWNYGAGTVDPYTIDPNRLAGVQEDVNIAITLGMAVIIDIHHYTELIAAAQGATKDPVTYAAEKARFTAIWRQISAAFSTYPDSMVVLEILNEPNGIAASILDELNRAAYLAIREFNPGKTIMVNPNGYAKFGQLSRISQASFLKTADNTLDGNIIISGHYYEPYTFTHQGVHGYACGGTWSETGGKILMTNNFQAYVDSATKYFPDVNGGHIPLNMGEFGVAGVNTSGCENSELPSDAQRGAWVGDLISVVESLGISWNYWGFSGVGGFEAYDKDYNMWYPELLSAMIPSSPSL